MASLPPSTTTTGLTSDATSKMLELVTQSMAIYAGQGSRTNVMETLLSKFDRFGNAPKPINSESVGLTFITRPRLNLSTPSLRQDPKLAMLDSMDPMDMMFSLRCNLDTVFSQSTEAREAVANCPWFNPNSGLSIPLSNMITGMSGWPDFGVEHETTETGHFGENMSMVRGSEQGRGTYPLSCTFRDIQGGYIMAYIFYWLHVMALQMEGTVAAYADDREANRLNYTCSIYRFVLDPSMRTIVKWAKATGCFPSNVPLGEVFNFSAEDHFINASQEFTVPFIANHVSYMDPRHLKQFNTLVERYAGSGFPKNGIVTKSSTYIPAPPLAENNFKGLPYIDLYNGTNQLMYMVPTKEAGNPTKLALDQLAASVDGAMAQAIQQQYTETSLQTAST